MSQITTEEYIEVNGIKEYTYQVTEENLPIAIFVHGSGTPDSLFAYLQAKDYEGVCSCIFYDQRGAGKTYRKNKSVIPTFLEMQTDLYETILYFTKKFHQEKIILVANSLGTILATPVVKKHPELILSYIVSGFIPCMRDCESYTMELVKKRVKEPEYSAYQQKCAQLSDYPPEIFNGKDTMKFRQLEEKLNLSNPVTPEMKRMMMKSPIFEYSDLFAMLKSPKINDKLFHEIWTYQAAESGYDFKVPFCFLHGENDYIAPLFCAKSFFDQLEAPMKSFLPISKAGHITGIDNKDEYNSGFIKFISQLGLKISDKNV